jgi:hypothetical protein
MSTRSNIKIEMQATKQNFKQVIFWLKFHVRNFLRKVLGTPSHELLSALRGNGIVKIPNAFSRDELAFIFAEYNFAPRENEMYTNIPLSNNHRDAILDLLKQKGLLRLIKEYVGSTVWCYEVGLYTLSSAECNDGSMQPHHDAKSNRLKLFIWLSDQDPTSHPVFYLPGDHKKLKSWSNYEDTRKCVAKEKMLAVHGDVGDVIVFDTHGTHANTKTYGSPRTVIQFDFDPTGLFFWNECIPSHQRAKQELGAKTLNIKAC